MDSNSITSSDALLQTPKNDNQSARDPSASSSSSADCPKIHSTPATTTTSSTSASTSLPASHNAIKPLTPRNRRQPHHHHYPATSSPSDSCTNNACYATPNNSNNRALQRRATANRFHLLHAVNSTPPSPYNSNKPTADGRPSSTIFVHNPFEAALVERLHLPLIGSPSLFQRPSTPLPHSSPQFEWTIDDVSALNPTHVEAHETQFISVHDPEQEARAQAAIATYFREKLVVPSPVDCPLRKRCIEQLLPAAKRKRKALVRKAPQRDAVCQTVLTIPPHVSAELENALRPFCTFTADQQQQAESAAAASASPSNCRASNGDLNDDQDDADEAEDEEDVIDHDARDASLRRKLFNTSPAERRSSERFWVPLEGLELVNCSPPPGSPELVSARTFFWSRKYPNENVMPNSDRNLSRRNAPTVRHSARSACRCHRFVRRAPSPAAIDAKPSARRPSRSDLCRRSQHAVRATIANRCLRCRSKPAPCRRPATKRSPMSQRRKRRRFRVHAR